jgi:hypothetical protein
MLIFAVTFFSSAPNHRVAGPMSLFLVVWFVGLIAVIIYHVVNATRSKGLPTQIIESEDSDAAPKSAAERLEGLEELRSSKLVSDAEYEAKRQEILKQL